MPENCQRIYALLSETDLFGEGGIHLLPNIAPQRTVGGLTHLDRLERLSPSPLLNDGGPIYGLLRSLWDSDPFDE